MPESKSQSDRDAEERMSMLNFFRLREVGVRITKKNTQQDKVEQLVNSDPTNANTTTTPDKVGKTTLTRNKKDSF
jgi:hypothetical protein